MDHYILQTEADRDTCNAEVFAAHMADHAGDQAYIDTTTKWSNDRQRETDGAWIVPVCEHYGNPHGYIIETRQENWNPIGEI